MTEPTNGSGNGKGHNGERAESIRNAITQIAKLEAKRKTIGEEIREIKQVVIKGDLNMKIGDFNAALRLYNLEGDARNQFLATLHETFGALGIGDQLDFMAAIDAATPKDSDEGQSDAVNQGPVGDAA